MVFVLVETDLESARERLREFSTVPEGVSSIQIWEEWVPTMPELMKARDELRRSLWKRLLMGEGPGSIPGVRSLAFQILKLRVSPIFSQW